MQDRTLSSVKIRAFRRFDDGTSTGEAWASGFFWKHDARRYLLTNWHNATGRNSFNGTYIGSFAPSHFEVFYTTHFRPDVGTTRVRAHAREVSLFDSDGSVWIEHPNGPSVDIVAIELPKMDDELATVFLNEMDFETRWEPKAGAECFIVGFPEGVGGPLGTAIHKRASVASEPNASEMADQPILVDTLGNPGLSGSPVFARGTGLFNPGFERGLRQDTVLGTWETFLGMYSGRIGDLGLGLQLGRVVSAKDVGRVFEKA